MKMNKDILGQKLSPLIPLPRARGASQKNCPAKRGGGRGKERGAFRERAFSLLLAVMLFFAAPAAYAACTNPAGDEGEQLYNLDHHMMQFCNGTAWVAMGSAGGGSGAGGIQSGITATGTLAGACAILGALSKDGSGNLLVCDDTPSIMQGGTCASFAAGAITYDIGGASYVCNN